MSTRGIRAVGGYVPRHRLDRAAVRETFGKGGGAGTRAVAGFDEDTTTMAVEACRAGGVHHDPSEPPVGALWFATTDPAYLDKTNAATIHAALALPATAAALDFGGALRSGIGALGAALAGAGETLVVASDRRGGLPTSADETNGGDGAAAIRVGDASDGPLLATLLAQASVTTEILDRWRTPGDDRSRAWEERFAEASYVQAATTAFDAAVADAGLNTEDIDLAMVTGMHDRAVRRAGAKLGVGAHVTDPVGRLAEHVGNTGVAHPLLCLAAALEAADPGTTIAVVHLADGADALIVRTTDAVAGHEPPAPIESQIAAGVDLGYGAFLAWRGQVTIEPPNRPGPARVSAPAAGRRADWKFRFTGSRDRTSGMLHLPPARVSEKGGAVDDMDPVTLADTPGTVAAVTVDRLAYSPSPPVVFAVVDFDGGGRAPLELTDVGNATPDVGDRVTPTFRRLSTADGIHNYFWKVKPWDQP